MQLQSHFGWKSPNMAMEYVTKSKAAIKEVAGLLKKEDGDVPKRGEGFSVLPSTDSLPSTSGSKTTQVFHIHGGVFNGGLNFSG